MFIPGDTISGCRIEYSSSETNMRGNLTIENTKHCQILYTGIDNDNTDDNDIVPELITSEYVIKAYDMNHNDVAAVESVANITVTNTTSPNGSLSTEQSDNSSEINESMTDKIINI